MDVDILYDNAVAYVRRRGDISCAGLQRNLRIGYSLAKQLQTRMEQNGIFAGMEKHVEPAAVTMKVVGVGGAGCVALDEMIRKAPPGVESIAMNADTQALRRSTASKTIQLGMPGLGGATTLGIASDMACHARQEIAEALCGAHLVIIAAGMGGNTGAGAAPVAAQIAKEQGALCLCVAYAPWSVESEAVHKNAATGMHALATHADSVFVIQGPALDGEEGRRSLPDLLRSRDRILQEIVAFFVKLFSGNGNVTPSLMDVKLLLRQQGRAMIGSGRASGPDRTRIGMEAACVVLAERGADTKAARGLLIVVTMSRDSKLVKPAQVMAVAGAYFAADVSMTMGYVLDDAMGDEIDIRLIATGM